MELDENKIGEDCVCANCMWGERCIGDDVGVCEGFYYIPEEEQDSLFLEDIIECNRYCFKREWNEYLENWDSENDE